MRTGSGGDAVTSRRLTMVTSVSTLDAPLRSTPRTRRMCRVLSLTTPTGTRSGGPVAEVAVTSPLNAPKPPRAASSVTAAVAVPPAGTTRRDGRTVSMPATADRAVRLRLIGPVDRLANVTVFSTGGRAL